MKVTPINTRVATENVNASVVSTATAFVASTVAEDVPAGGDVLVARSGVVSLSAAAAAAVDVDTRGVVSSAGTRVGDVGRGAGDEVSRTGERSAMMLEL